MSRNQVAAHERKVVVMELSTAPVDMPEALQIADSLILCKLIKDSDGISPIGKHVSGWRRGASDTIEPLSHEGAAPGRSG